MTATPDLRVAWIIPGHRAGGVASACHYAAAAVARHAGCQCTVVALHDPPEDSPGEAAGVRLVSLGIPLAAPGGFLAWLRRTPFDVVITNDVSKIESCFPFFPEGMIHIVQIHDSARKYLRVALRNQRVIDGVLCVARHIETKLRPDLSRADFRGRLGVAYNGADFPAPPVRSLPSGPLRLLFTGSLDPLVKGIFDLVEILRRVNDLEVPVALTIAGGHHDALASRLKKRGLSHLVSWAGKVPHHECYRLAAESEVFLQPSRHESFGMVTLEAMSMGCVPIAYDIPSGNRELIESGKNGLLVPLGDFPAWAASILSLHQSRPRLRELGAAAMLRARTHFNSETLAKGIGEFLTAIQRSARSHPSQRSRENPEPAAPATRKLSYSRLPPRFRGWVRNVVGSYPYLSWWWLNR